LLRREGGKAKPFHFAVDDPKLQSHARLFAGLERNRPVLPFRGIQEIPGAGAFNDVGVGVDYEIFNFRFHTLSPLGNSDAVTLMESSRRCQPRVRLTTKVAKITKLMSHNYSKPSCPSRLL